MSRKILIVDDEKDVQALLRLTFQKAGDKVYSALDAVQGLMLARQISPDVIILDINMPGGGGYNAYERLSQLTTTSQIPIVIYSQAPADEVKGRIPESPATTFLAKPAAPEAVVSAVNALLGR